MSKHLGDFDTSAVIYGHFSTFQPSTGATFLLGGSPVLSVYKDNSATQSTTGVSLTANFDSVTGLNLFTVDTSADGAFYSAGSFFSVVITTGTVDSVSITGAVVASFTLHKASALRPATSGRQLVVDASGLADANTVKLGPTGSGTAQTARDIGANVLLSPGTGTGQITLTGGAVTVVSTQLPVAIKKNTALNGFTFLMVDGSNVPVTGLTVTSQRSIDGGSLGACANSASEISGGLYTINLATTDLNGNFIMLVFSATGAQTRYVPVITQT